MRRGSYSDPDLGRTIKAFESYKREVRKYAEAGWNIQAGSDGELGMNFADFREEYRNEIKTKRIVYKAREDEYLQKGYITEEEEKILSNIKKENIVRKLAGETREVTPRMARTLREAYRENYLDIIEDPSEFKSFKQLSREEAADLAFALAEEGAVSESDFWNIFRAAYK